MLPQDESIKTLGDSLREYIGQRIKGVSVETIQKFIEIVLKENVFTYNHKFYRQTIGAAMSSPFTLTLANIFMRHWEKRWVQQQNSKNEIYGRHTRLKYFKIIVFVFLFIILDTSMMFSLHQMKPSMLFNN